jgi:phospholipid/cholesterol/gamma-HCH transport system permease protein
VNKIFEEVAKFTLFTFRAIRYSFHSPFEFSEFIRQCYIAGVKTLGLVSITALIMGLVLTLQTRPVLVDLGAESILPGMVFISVLREIGPVIFSLIFAGKVGSGIGAELSSMRVTEQIDAMEVSGTYPMKFLVSTRVLAATFILPVLIVYGDFIALMGTYLGISISGSISLRLFFRDAFSVIGFMDIIPSIIKTYFFGFAIGILSCYKGYFTNKGAEGVGEATNSAVVYSSLSIFILDLLAVQITEIIS